MFLCDGKKIFIEKVEGNQSNRNLFSSSLSIKLCVKWTANATNRNTLLLKLISECKAERICCVSEANAANLARINNPLQRARDHPMNNKY